MNAQGELAVTGKVGVGEQKLKFKEVAGIVNSLIGKSTTSSSEKEGLQTELAGFAQRTLDKYKGRLLPWSRGSNAVANEIVNLHPSGVIAGAGSVSRVDEKPIPIDHFQELKSVLSDPSHTVTRSPSGKDGVYFCKLEERNIPLKFIKQPQKIIYADSLLQAMGFKTPESRHIPVNVLSNEAKADLLQRSARTDDEQMAASKKAKAPLHPIQMQYLKETPWEDTEFESRLEYVKDPHFGQQIGKMILMDVVLGNSDRLSRGMKDPKTGDYLPGAFNQGNLMIGGKNNLALCDNEIHLDDVETRDSRKGALQELVGQPEMLPHYVSGMVEGLQGHLNTQDVANFHENVRAGVIEGAKELVALCKDKKMLEAVFSSAELPPGAPSVNYAGILRSLGKVVESALKQ